MTAIDRWFRARVLSLVGLGAFLAAPAFAADEWTLYSNLFQVRDIAHDGDSLLWVATSGGVVRFDKRTAQRTNVFTSITSFDGLATNSTVAVAVDGTGKKWFAHDEFGAGLSVLDSEGRWSTIPPRDGLLLREGDKANTLLATGDSVWVGTESGLTLFRGIRDPEIRLDMDDGLPANNVQAIARQGRFVWVGTEGGLARLEGGFVTTYTEADGLANNNVLSLAVSKSDPSELWVGTEDGISIVRAQGDSIRAVTTSGLASRAILAIDFQDSLPWVGTASSGLVTGDGGPARLEGDLWRRFVFVVGQNPDNPPSRGLYSVRTPALAVFEDEVWVGSEDPLNTSFASLSVSSGTFWFDFLSQGRLGFGGNRARIPLTNFFGSLDIDPRGNIWTTSSIRRDGEVPGEYSQVLKFNGNDIFRDFRRESFNDFGSNLHDVVRVGPLDEKWFGFWDSQGGLATLNRDETSVTLRNISTLCDGVAQTGQTCTQIQFDAQGRLWATLDFTGLVCIDVAGDSCVTWTTADGLSNQPVGATANALALDAQGRAWVGLFEADLTMVDPRGTVFDKTDDLVVRYTAATTPLPSSTIHAVNVDTRGRIWIGTEAGLAILDPSDDTWVVHRVGTQILDGSIRSIELLPDGSALIGDNSGNVYTLQGDLTTFGPTYNGRTVGFPPKRVSDIQFDAERSTDFTNVVWFVTYGGGIVRADLDLRADGRQAGDKAARAFAHPNPYIGNDGSNGVTISGLQPGSSVWLYTMLGEVVKRLTPAPGDSLVTWDTRNQLGQAVASGLYIYMVRRDGLANETGKLAIVR